MCLLRRGCMLAVFGVQGVIWEVGSTWLLKPLDAASLC